MRGDWRLGSWLRPPRRPRRRVVIVGAGFGGLNAAKALSDAAVEVVLIDRANHHLFQPLLYQVATAALSPADIAVAVRSRLRKQKNATMLMAEVTGVDVDGRRVLLSDSGSEPYDWLVLATGADYNFFGHPDWSEHAFVLKTLDDALSIRRTLLQAFERAELEVRADETMVPTFVVVGGGPTGVELAGAIAELARTSLAGDFRRSDPNRARIILFEAGPRLLQSFPEHLAGYARRALVDLGVEVRTGAAVGTIGPGLVIAAGEQFETDGIFWCAGVQARPAARWIGAAPADNGAAPTGLDCASEAYSDIFIIGDVASHLDRNGRLPALAPVAKQQGRYVGAVIRAHLGERRHPGAFKYRDWGSMAVIGRSRAVATFGRLSLKGGVAWWAWSLVHLMLLVDFRSRLSVYLNWTWAWFTRGRGARLITGQSDQKA